MRETIQGKCWSCGTELGPHDYGREDNCLQCTRPTRVCRNCRWYDPGVTDQCAEPMADRVMEKERSNYCEYFEPAAAPLGAGAGAQDALLQAAEELFKF